jgi:VIT1/CCC1 family predicted Fe2+/Mn2+ transporter
MAVITVPKVLREKLGEDGADGLVELINLANQKVKEDVIELSAEKFERRLTEEMAKVNQRITDEIAKLRGEVKEEMAQLRSVDLAKLDKRITDEVAKLDKRITDEVAGLKVEIATTRAELIRWMFIFWVGQIGVLIGILFAFFKR